MSKIKTKELANQSLEGEIYYTKITKVENIKKI